MVDLCGSIEGPTGLVRALCSAVITNTLMPVHESEMRNARDIMAFHKTLIHSMLLGMGRILPCQVHSQMPSCLGCLWVQHLQV